VTLIVFVEVEKKALGKRPDTEGRMNFDMISFAVKENKKKHTSHPKYL
jgi:hypothetical protein